jgi:isopenicillin N synthase-like dioxygenase
MTAPYELGANVPTGATCFSLTKLREEDNPTGTLSQQLCKEMRENHFIIVRLDEEGQSALNGVWMAARRFFDLPSEQKEAIAGRMRKEKKHQKSHRRV